MDLSESFSRQALKMIKCGVDLVFIPDFKKRVERSGEGFLKKIFLESELKNTEASRLDGVFAAKEAVMRALEIKAGSWHKIEVSYDKKRGQKCRFRERRFKVVI